MSEQLTIQENTRLRHCEAVIERSMNSFYEMGVALREVRDSRLYKEDFNSFEEYCEKKWAISKPYAIQTISASNVMDELNQVAMATIPTTERQVRPLTKLKDPELQKKVWQEVVFESAQTSEPITAKKVEQKVMEYCDPCINNSIEFRRVFYLTPYYNNKLEKLIKKSGDKESTFLRKIIEGYCDNAA